MSVGVSVSECECELLTVSPQRKVVNMGGSIQNTPEYILHFLSWDLSRMQRICGAASHCYHEFLHGGCMSVARALRGCCKGVARVLQK